jgi:16S rRNA (cytosine967-C5)-methyltransferase
MKTEARIQSTIELIDIILSTPSVPADSIVNTYFRERRFIGSGDRRFVSEFTYQILRQFPKLQWFWPDINARKAALIYLTINEKESLKKIEQIFSGDQFSPSPLTHEEKEYLKNINHLPQPPKWAALSVSEWLFPYFEKSLNTDLDRELNALNEQAPLDLRVNTFKQTRQAVLKQLTQEGLDPKPTALSPVGIRLSQRLPLPSHPLWKDGTLEVQDEGSQLIALLCNAKPGMAILDYCAGAGGKSLVLAETMQNKGRLVLSDIHSWRLKRAKERLKRAGIHNHEVRLIEEKEWFKRQEGRFDCVLVDAPCSGTGTWRRNPDMKIRFSKKDLDELIDKQQEILNAASKLVKSGGLLIYSTCSLLREENHEQIEKFAQQKTSFNLVPIQEVWQNSIKNCPCPTKESMLQLTPAVHQTDGFFIAVLRYDNLG